MEECGQVCVGVLCSWLGQGSCSGHGEGTVAASRLLQQDRQACGVGRALLVGLESWKSRDSSLVSDTSGKVGLMVVPVIPALEEAEAGGSEFRPGLV